MENVVYVIEFEAESHKNGDYDNIKREHRVFGVFDTERRALCYLRRFMDEEDIAYKMQRMETVEYKNAPTCAEASRCYECNDTQYKETLYMRPMELNAMGSPYDEIVDTYC